MKAFDLAGGVKNLYYPRVVSAAHRQFFTGVSSAKRSFTAAKETILANMIRQGKGMLYFEKQPADKPFKRIITSLNAGDGEQTEPRLGNPPVKREFSLVEELFAFDGPPDATVSVGGDIYYYFSGEGYLGLQAHPEVLASTCEAVLHYGTSSGSLRRRYTPVPILEVQRQSAEIFDTEQALYCGGEAEALGHLLESVIDSYDLVLIDELCSDQTYSAVRRVIAHSAARLASFKHRDPNDLKRVLARKTKTRMKTPLVITDGVFNVSGAIAPLPDYYDVLSVYPNAAILIDDSDGFGVLGEKGRGTLEYFDYETEGVNRTRQDGQSDPTYGISDFSYSEPDFDDEAFGETEAWEEEEEDGCSWSGEDEEDEEDLFPSDSENTSAKSPLPVRTYLVASLARAIGGFGAIIPGSPSFLDRIRDSARFQLSVYPPTPLGAATVKGLQLSFYRDEIRHKLWNNVYYFKSEMRKLGFDVQENKVPIVSFSVGSDQNMRRIQHAMIKDQILVSFLSKINARHPEGNIRTALFASHERVMLDIFLDSLQKLL